MDSPTPSEIYNLDTNQWSTGPSVPTPTGDGPCMVTYKDSFVIMGGTSYSNGIQQYNLTSKTWKSLGYLNAGFGLFGCTLLPAGPDSKASSAFFTSKILMMHSSAGDVSGAIYDIENNEV
jgi:hypothetical protein